MVEKNRNLTNPDAAKVYDLEIERGVGIAKKLIIGPHAQYRMDLRQITVPLVRAALKTFSKLLNDWKSQKSPKYQTYVEPMAQGKAVSFTEPRLNLTIVFAVAGKGTIKLVTAYWEGKPDPKTPGQGCEVMPLKVAARWQRKRAGMWEYPPAMFKEIREWVIPIIAGTALEKTEELLKRYTAKDEAQSALKRVDEVIRNLPSLLKRVVGRKNVLNVPIGFPEYPIDMELSWVTALPQWNEPARYKIYMHSVPGQKLVDETDDPVPVAAEMLEKHKEWLEGQIDIRLGLGEKSHGQVKWTKKNFVELLLLRKELHKWTTKPKGRKTDASMVFPIDLTGWKYLNDPDVTPERIEAVTKPPLGRWQIEVRLAVKPRKSWFGLWQFMKGRLSVGMPRMRQLSVQAFHDAVGHLDEILAHELRHLGQDYLRLIKKLKEEAGLPSKDIREEGWRPGGAPARGGPRRQHHLRDVEFYTNLGSMIDHFKIRIRPFGMKDREDKAKEFAAVTEGRFTHWRFKALKKEAPPKWRKAVKEFMKAVEDELP